VGAGGRGRLHDEWLTCGLSQGISMNVGNVLKQGEGFDGKVKFRDGGSFPFVNDCGGRIRCIRVVLSDSSHCHHA
jgi:hypothetical protein